MKKNILAIAIASAVAAPVAMADAPTVYGQFNVAIDNISVDGGASSMDVVNRNSRVGVKGSEDLGNGLKAVYQLETTVNVPDGGSNGSFGGARNTFVGVAGGFGTIVMGRHDSPLRMIQPSDGFADNWAAGNNRSNFNGGLAGEDRLDEVVAYLSPDFNGIKFAAALTGQNNLAAYGDDQALTNAMSFNLTYGSKKSGIFAAVGMTTTGESQAGGTAPVAADAGIDVSDAQDGSVIVGASPAVAAASGERGDITRATVQYKEGGILASFMYNGQADVGNSMTLAGAYKMGALTPRAKVAMVTYDNKDANGDDSAMNMAVGVDYALGKKTRVYAEYASLAEGTRTSTGGSRSATTAMSVGLFHKF